MRGPIVIHHHLGMGDHFTCCGLVRTLLRRYERIYLVAKQCNAENVRFLYRDELRVIIVPVQVARDGATNEDKAVSEVVHQIRKAEPDCYFQKIGHNHYGEVEREAGGYIQNDQVFYRQLGIPYEFRFDKFYFKRDRGAEGDVVDRLTDGERYIFVDHNPERPSQPIPDSVAAVKRDPEVRIVYNDMRVPILHLGALLENAEEIHLNESAIRCMVEATMFDMSKPKLYLNGNLRGNNTRLPWLFSNGDSALRYPMYRGEGGAPTKDGHQRGPYDVHPVEPNDAGLLAALFPYLGDYFHPHPLTPEFATLLANHVNVNTGDYYCLATVGGEPVAYGMLRGFEEGYAVPSLGLSVHRDHRGCGLGHRMMQHLHQVARARGCEEIRLRTHPENRARFLYQSFGYAPVGTERGEMLMKARL